ncbi:UNVERIFIED_ORG: hypothetical protein E4P37_15355 [Bacillus sp. AZ43]
MQVGAADTAMGHLLPPVPRSGDAAQEFVAAVRASAAAFAAAAGASTAVVREAVPPARHRRARCRVVLRAPDGAEADLTVLGAAGRADASAGRDFDRLIRRWLAAGRPRAAAWLVADPGVPGGAAVDLAAWSSAD